MYNKKKRVLSGFLSFVMMLTVVLGILSPVAVSATAPNITTEAAYDIEIYEATVSAYVKTNGGNLFKEHGFYYGKTSSCSTKVVVDDNGGSGTSLDTPDRYTYTFDDLDMNTKYYYKAYVLTTTGSYYYGGVGSFTTDMLEYDIFVKTIDTDGDQTMNTIEMSAELYVDVNYGKAGAVRVGFEWGKVGGTTKKTTDTMGYYDGDEFGWRLTDLSSGTSYRYRGFAINPVNQNYVYGDWVTITTLDESDFIPEVSTNSATSITMTSAVLNGSLDYTAGETTEYGFILGADTTTSQKIGSTTKTKDFEYKWTGLQPNTKYTYKTYAENEYGTVYGTVKTFTTKSDTTKPVIEVLESSLGNEFTYGSAVTFTAEASDNVALSEFILYVDNVEVDYSDYRTDYEEVEYSTNKLSVGSHTIKAYAVDDAGNEATKTITVKVSAPAVPEIIDVSWNVSSIIEGTNVAYTITTGGNVDTVKFSVDSYLLDTITSYTTSGNNRIFKTTQAIQSPGTRKINIVAYAGSVASETYTETIVVEEAELLAETKITSPVSTGTYTAGNAVQFKWNAVDGATYYKIAVRDVTDGDNSDSDMLIYSDENYTSSTRSVTISASKFVVGHTYKFAVGAYSEYAEPESWGGVTITIEPEDLLDVVAITSPVVENIYIPGESIALKWNAVSGATYYKVAVRDVTNGDNTDADKLIYNNEKYTSADRLVTISGNDFVEGHTYKFAVGAYSDTALPEAWGIVNIPIKSASELTLGKPTMTSPSYYGIYEAGKDVSVSWEEVNRADYYAYEIYDITDGLPGEVITGGTTENKNITIPGNLLLANHVIEIYLTANTYSGAVSEKSFNCIVIGASDNSITASDEEVIISSSGGSDTITVYSSGEWTARKSDSWFTISKNKGDGDGTIKITAERNTTSDIRIGSIKLQDDTGEYYVIVQQAAKASAEFFNNIRVVFDSNSVTLRENDIFTFNGSAYNTEVNLDKVHVSITKIDDPDVGIDYFRAESIGDSVFDFSDIPSFYADETLYGLMVTNTQSSLTLVPGESYYINIWVTDEDGYSSGKIQKTITIAESITYNINTPVIDNDQLTNTNAYIEATIVNMGVSSISDYGFNILTEAGDVYQQYSLWQTGIFKDVTYNKESATFSINASDLEIGTTYYIEAFVIDSEGNVSFSDRSNFTTKSAGVTITQPSNNKVYAANTTSIEFIAEVIGSGYSSTTFKVYDYDMNATGYVFSGSGNKPSVTWNISGVDKGTYYVQAETLLNDGTLSRSEYIKFDLYIPISKATIIDDGDGTITAEKGKTRFVSAKITPSNATSKKLIWGTGDKSIATVDKYGVVSGVAEGETVLYAWNENYELVGQCPLIVAKTAPTFEALGDFEFSMGDTTDSAVLVGPTIELGGEEFPLFEFPLNFKVPGTMWEFKTKYNEETETVQLILGRELCESVKIHQKVDDSDAYWKKTYAQLKDMMNSFGVKTSSDFYNKFRKIKSDIRNNSPLQKADLGFKFDTELYGYIELNKNFEFVEGAVVLALSTEMSVKYPLPPAPVVSIVFSIAADAKGKLMLVPRTTYYSGYDLKGELSLGITPAIAANIDVKAAEAEAKIDATLQFDMDLPLKSLEKSLKISIVNAKLTLSYQMLKFINGKKVISLGDDIQLYPNTSASQLMAANTFALFQEEIDSSYEMQLIDTRNSAGTYGRMMFALNSGVNEVFAKVKDEMIDEMVYCYEPVDAVQLDDGREFAVWVKTDRERNIANETTLYWSTKKNGVWETPRKIHDDGTADFKPILAKTSDGNVHLIWQNSVKEFDEDVTLNEMGAYTELYHSVFNGITFSTPTMITTNTDVMYNFVEVNTYENDLIVAWSESNIETDKSAVKYVLYSANTWTSPQVVIDGVAMVEDLSSGYINSKPVVVVKYDNDPLNAYSESILACHINGSLTTIDDSADKCTGLYVINGTIYYLDSNTLYSYSDMNKAYEGIIIPDNVSNYQLFVNDSGTSYIAYTAPSGKYNNIFIHEKEYNGEWSDAVQITDYDMKLYSMTGIVNNDELDVAYILAAADDSDGYPMSNLYFTSVSDKLDISITEFWYNTDTVMTDGVVPVTIVVKNNSLQTCDAYNVRIHDQDGNTIADTDITSALKPGKTDEITLNVQISDKTKDIVFYVTVDDSECIDVNRENNTVYIDISLNDIVLTYKSISKVDDDYVITIDVENRGVNTVSGITATLYEQNNNGNIINSAYIKELLAGTNVECEFLVSSKKFDFADETNLISFYAKASSECSELSYENNSKSLIFSYDDINALQPDGNYNVSGQIISYGSANDATIIRVINNMGNIVASTTTTSGKYYLSVPTGNYTLEVSKADHVTREYEINVGTTEITQDVKICLLGDVTGDGKITMVDAARANSHAKGKQLLTGYELQCADTVKQDGKVTIADAARINSHAKGKSKLW